MNVRACALTVRVFCLGYSVSDSYASVSLKLTWQWHQRLLPGALQSCHDFCASAPHVCDEGRNIADVARASGAYLIHCIEHVCKPECFEHLMLQFLCVRVCASSDLPRSCFFLVLQAPNRGQAVHAGDDICMQMCRRGCMQLVGLPMCSCLCQGMLGQVFKTTTTSNVKDM